MAVAALALLASACSCGKPQSGAGDAGVRDGSVVSDAGQGGFDAGGAPVDGGDDDAGLPPPELKITRLLPPRGPSNGGVSVLVEGSGFLRDFALSGTQAKPRTTLKFGANPVIDFQIIDDVTLEARVPPGLTGQASVSIQNPNGRVVCNNCFTYFDELVVTAFTPKEGLVSGGNEVTITGKGFTADVQVLFGGRSSPTITVVSPSQLRVIVPQGAAADQVDLVVYNKNGVSTQRRGYRYFNDVRVTAIAPLTGALAGGTSVTVTGAGFTGATGVTFGANAGVALVVTDDAHLTVEAPAAAAAGAVTLTVVTPRGSASVKNGFTYFDPTGAFAVFGVYPHVVRPGDVITVTGQALDLAPFDLTIGGVPVTIGARTFSTALVTVPARGAAPRKSDLTPSVGPALPGAVTWRVTPQSVSPTRGPATGGTSVSLMAEALPGDVQVFVGALAATSTVVVSESALTFSTPRGSGGAASDVRVREAADLENEATLPGAFTFLEPLAIGRVQPDRGAIAGNTQVTVLGAGFGDSTVVVFANNRAKDVKIVDSHTLTCRTPKGDVGTIDVRVERLTERDTLPGGFSYFDPRSISGGASGGPLVGTLNVTVLDSTNGSYGAPVPLATVLLGVDSATPFQGTTDARGQVTFSDPSLVKAQTVTVFKNLYQSVSVTQVASENLTVFISRTGGGGGSGSGTPPPGTPASTIAGRVTGFKAPRPLTATETLEARVFVAQTSLFGGVPFSSGPTHRGETWKLASDGASYFVTTGAGLHAVYAVLGIVNSGTMAFTPVTMGVKRGVTTSPDVPATGEDIVLDMQLDLTVPIFIDSPLEYPSPLGDVPGINRIYAWLDLGAEGFIPNPNNWGTGGAVRSSVESNQATLSFPNFPQLDGSNFVFLDECASPSSYPISYSFRRQPGSMKAGVTIGPLLPAPRLGRFSGFEGTIAWTIDPGAVPDMFDIELIRISAGGTTTVWSMVMPGTESSVVLPASSVTKLKIEEQGNSLYFVMFGIRSPKFSYNQWTYESLSTASWSSFTISVSNSFVVPPQ